MAAEFLSNEVTRGEARMHTLFRVAEGLASKLRSVFVPYFQQLVDPAVQALEFMPSDSQTPKRRKKHEDMELVEAALVGVRVLVDTLGGFLTPHLPQLLRLVLHPHALEQPTAVALRELLPQKLPARVLLPPLRTAWAECPSAAAAAAHLELLASTLQDPATVKAQHVGVMEFLLEVLDLRSAPGAFDLEGVQLVEGAAVALIGIERRLDAPRNARRYARQTLTRMGRTGAYTQAGKTSAADGALPASLWQLRTQVVLAYGQCFAHDTVQFLDKARFDALLPAIVAQLEAVPPSGGGLPGPEAAQEPVVPCLVNMAVAAGADTLWKPLNHAVLLCGRSQHPRTRLLALEVTVALVQRLQEEFLILLPETLPTLSELMEDSEEAIESKCQELLELLEQVSGEDLKSMLG
eukprot:gene7348-8745_t